jgi:hypothetical protein
MLHRQQDLQHLAGDNLIPLIRRRAGTESSLNLSLPQSADGTLRSVSHALSLPGRSIRTLPFSGPFDCLESMGSITENMPTFGLVAPRCIETRLRELYPTRITYYK